MPSVPPPNGVSCTTSNTWCCPVLRSTSCSGRTRWKTPRRQPADQAYTTPLVIRAGGRDQVVSVGAYRAVAYDPPRQGNLARVLRRRVLERAAAGIRAGTRLHRHGVSAAGSDRRPAGRLRRRDALPRRVDPPPRRAVHAVTDLVGDHLFIVNDAGIATCVDAKTGTIHWQQRLGGNYSASPVHADGRIYFPSEEGVTTVIEPGTTFKRLADESAGRRHAGVDGRGRAVVLHSTQSHLYQDWRLPLELVAIHPAADSLGLNLDPTAIASPWPRDHPRIHRLPRPADRLEEQLVARHLHQHEVIVGVEALARGRWTATDRRAAASPRRRR